MSSRALEIDARNRALRTFLTGLTLDVAVAVATLAVTLTAPGADWPGLTVVAASLTRTVVQAAASYVLRRYLDPSRLPTPLPPAPQPHPSDPLE